MTDNTLLRLKDRLDELDRKIDEATGWGAALAVMLEERDNIAKQLGLPSRRLVGGFPKAD